MNSDRLQAFIQTSRPAEVVWSSEKIRSLAEKAGLKVESGKVVSKGSDGYAILDQPMVVTWEEKLHPRKGLVVFSPRVKCQTGWFKGIASEPEKLLIEAAGLTTHQATLPERVVVLPRAPWDHSHAWNWDSGLVEDTLVCFVSEATGEVLPFIESLLKCLLGLD